MLLNIDKLSSSSLLAVDSGGNQLSQGDVIKLSNVLKKKLPGRSLLFLMTENNVGGIAWVLACLLSGNVPVILSAHTEIYLLNSLVDTYLPQFVCAPSRMAEVEEIEIEYFGYSLWGTGNPASDLNPELSHLLPTSGSTGSPKLVRHKYENIEATAINISTFFKLSYADRPLMVLPLHYTMGLSMVFSHVIVGATIYITNLSMTDPKFWKFMKENKVTSFTGVPYSYEILDKMRFTRMNLPDLTLLTQGGGKMSEELNMKFVEYCRNKGKRWIATYGQSEGTARMAWLPEEYALTKLGSIGIAVPNGRLSLRDAEGKEIIESPAIGEMCYYGKNVTMGYAQTKEDLTLGDERNGFLPTGDIAYRDIDGFYYIKGRIGRFLKIFGNRIGLDECEHIVKSAVDCECACTGNDDKLIAYISDSKMAAKAKEVLLGSTRLPANVIEIRILQSLPKNEAGKILYSELKKE